MSDQTIKIAYTLDVELLCEVEKALCQQKTNKWFTSKSRNGIIIMIAIGAVGSFIPEINLSILIIVALNLTTIAATPFAYEYASVLNTKLRGRKALGSKHGSTLTWDINTKAIQTQTNTKKTNTNKAPWDSISSIKKNKEGYLISVNEKYWWLSNRGFESDDTHQAFEDMARQILGDEKVRF